MAAFGSADGVRSPKQVWCFSAADERRATDALIAQYRARADVEVFSVDFPEVNEAALQSASWRKTAEDCTRIALAMYLKHQQEAAYKREEQEELPTAIPLRRAAWAPRQRPRVKDMKEKGRNRSCPTQTL